MIEPSVIARAINDIGALSLFGSVVFRLAIAQPVWSSAHADAPDRTARRLDALVWASLALAILGSLGWLVLQAAEMSGEPLPEGLAALSIILPATHFGRAWSIRFGLFLLVGVCERLRLRGGGHGATMAWGAVGAAGLAVAAQAWLGHAVALEGRAQIVLLASQSAHLLAAGAWVGSLLPLALLLAAIPPGSAALAAARRFSTLGIICVLLLGVSALGNAWLLIGSVPALLGTPYGHDCLIKAGLFAGMLCLAAVNRFGLTPRLQEGPEASRQLRRTVTVEAALGLVLLAVAAHLASLPPGAHVESWWPLPRRFSTEALQLPGVEGELLGWAVGVIAGLALAVTAPFIRRLGVAGRVIGPVLGLAIVVFCLRTPYQLLSAEAFPTSFWQSPTGYDARSIAEGARRFADNCAACHGTEGRGDGPAAAALRIPPADLTADHVYDHSDGDLYWWISNGMDDGLMPGFGDRLDQTARWNLIDFIHANADGARLAGVVTEDATRPKHAPDFRAQCADGLAVELSALRGKLVHLVFLGGDAAPRIRQLAAEPPQIMPVLVGPPTVTREAGLCRSDDPDLRAAYGLFVRGSEGGLDGTEFLIDGAGWLRLAWRPGMMPDWTDPAMFAQVVEAMGATPLPTGSVAPPMAMHMHMHH